MGLELLGTEFPEKFTWVTLHKWIRDHAKDITLCLYFLKEEGKTDFNPWREASPAVTAASVR
jgi:hypothetical protein